MTMMVRSREKTTQMRIRAIAKSLLLLGMLAFLITVAAAWFLGANTVPEWLDIATYVGLGMGALGALTFWGASAGSDGSAEIAASASDRPSGLMTALWMDRSAGISSGALLVIGGLIWLALAWGLAALAG